MGFQLRHYPKPFQSFKWERAIAGRWLLDFGKDEIARPRVLPTSRKAHCKAMSCTNPKHLSHLRDHEILVPERQLGVKDMRDPSKGKVSRGVQINHGVQARLSTIVDKAWRG